MNKNSIGLSERPENKKDLEESLSSIFTVLDGYDSRKHSSRLEYLRSLGKPALEEIINRFQEIVDMGCDEDMGDFVLPQTRKQDHYKQGELVYYVPEPEDPRDDYDYESSEVLKIESGCSWLRSKEKNLHVYLKNGKMMPLRSIRVISEKELDVIHSTGLLPRLEKLLLTSEQQFLQIWRKKINIMKLPERQEKVKDIVSVLLQRQDQVISLPRERQNGHYKVGDLVWYFPNDLYDRDMRGAEEEEYDYRFGMIEEVTDDGEPQGERGIVKPACIKVDGIEFDLRSNKVFSCDEILKIHNSHLYSQLRAAANHFEHMMPNVLNINIHHRWLKQAEEFGIDNLEDFFKLKETMFLKPKPIRI